MNAIVNEKEIVNGLDSMYPVARIESIVALALLPDLIAFYVYYF